jgi:hypothetical protein
MSARTVTDFLSTANHVLRFIKARRLPEHGPGAYCYAAGVQTPTLYASAYAAMARSLLGDLARVSTAERQAWSEYLNRHQDEDGLYRDPAIFGQGWYAGDPLWCGRPHLTCHIIVALTCLGAAVPRPIRWLEPWRDPGRLCAWLAERDWGARVGWTGNEVMNVGTLLQYARDVHGDRPAGLAVEALLEWLSSHHLDPASGIWGSLDLADPKQRSHAVQAAYHFWPLFFYERRPVPYVDRAIATVLATQNPNGGFGWGVHNPAAPFLSSACEDIDSIDPLCRMLASAAHRRADIVTALVRAVDWVLTNQMPDGGLVFVRDRDFEYGHPQLRGEAGVGAMFPTWFRLLSLALIGRALSEHPLASIPWHFVRCPGYQF